MPRPSEYSQEVADLVCERIADGESLRSICQADEMPNKATIFRWLAAHAAFSDQYARARDAQADALADEIIDIADDGRRDYGKALDGRDIVDHDHIARARLRVDARKWIAAKLKPKKYGDQLRTELTGADGGPVIFRALPLDEEL
jgi:hypothetical protein